jgi:hypothetical protein
MLRERSISQAPRILTSAADLAQWRQSHGVLGMARHSQVQLTFHGVPQVTIRDWEARLNSEMTECGCSQGATTALACVVFVGIFVWLTRDSLDAVAIVFFVVSFLFGGGTGKVLALRASARRFRRILDEIEEHLKRLSLSGKG